MSIQTEIIDAYIDEGCTYEEAYQKWSEGANNGIGITDLEGYEAIQDFILSEYVDERQNGLRNFLSENGKDESEIDGILEQVEEYVANCEYFEAYQLVLG